MQFENDTIDLPAFLASALINGDVSGLEFTNHTKADLALLEFIENDLSEEGWDIVGCSEEAHFGRYYGPGRHLTDWVYCDLLTYDLMKEKD